MINAVILFIYLIVNSCGAQLNNDRVSSSGTREFNSLSTDFADYIENFEQSGQLYLGNPYFKVNDIPVNFKDPGDEHVGVCKIYGDGTKEILIKQSWWQTTTEEKRIMLFFHEMAHCRLDRKEHNNSGLIIDGRWIKTSIMHEELPTTKDFQDFKSHYLSEIFLMNSPLMKK